MENTTTYLVSVVGNDEKPKTLSVVITKDKEKHKEMKLGFMDTNEGFQALQSSYKNSNKRTHLRGSIHNVCGFIEYLLTERSRNPNQPTYFPPKNGDFQNEIANCAMGYPVKKK